MPIRMIYEPDLVSKGVEIDVYHFHQENDTLKCFVTAWVIDEGYWLTVPLDTVRPITKTKKRRSLNG